MEEFFILKFEENGQSRFNTTNIVLYKEVFGLPTCLSKPQRDLNMYHPPLLLFIIFTSVYIIKNIASA